MLVKICKMGCKLGIYIPKRRRLYRKGDFVLLKVGKGYKKVKLITKFNHQIVIRKNFVGILELKQNEMVNINIKKIKNLKRTKKLFCKDKVDLLSLIPKNTSNSYKIIVLGFLKNKEEWLRIWYAHKRGSGNQLELKRFVDIKKFGSLLGQYQAEGSKPIYSKYPKYKVEFKNKLIEEHKEFLDSLFDLGINCNNVKARFCYNPLKISEKDIKINLSKFKNKIGILPSLSPNIGIKGAAFDLSINNTILMEIILSSLGKIRNSFFRQNIKEESYKILINNFFAKLLTGDGTLDIKIDKKYKYPATRIKIIDQNLEYLESYKMLMKNFGLSPKINLKYIYVKASLNFNTLLFLYKINAFKNTNNWNKLLINIDLLLKGRRLSTLKRYLDLVNYEIFKTEKISNDYNISMSASYSWLKNATREGYIIKFIKNSEGVNVAFWKTTSKANKLTNTLKQWQQDLNNLKSKKGISDSLTLLNSIKIKKRY